LMLYAQISLSQDYSNDDKYSSCSAVFLNDKMIVNEYSPEGKCKISKDATGEISAGEVSLGEKTEITSKFSFGIAIKSRNTGTLMLFSKETYKKIDVQKVLAKCRKGDYIVILTTDDQYALPHNEILVE
jgi:hypothetical protein